MNVSPDMRLSWLQRWQSMDEDGSNLLDYPEFLQACELRDNMWSWRMFNLLDKNFVEVAFRMCSRRGSTWDPDKSVLDEKDIRLFVEERILHHLYNEGLKDGPTSARARWARSMSPAELSSPVKIASKRETKHLAESARDISQSGGAIRELSARKMADTRDWLKVESEMLTEAAKGAARDLEKFGRLKATVTVAVAVNRMRALAEAARQRPDGETARNTGKRVGEAAKVGGEKALSALRRSFVAITAARYFSEAGPDPARGELRRHDQQRPTSANLEGGDPNVADSGDGMLLGEDEDSEDSQRAREDFESEVPATAVEKPWDILTDAKAKAEVKMFQERHWAVTEKFYANLVTASERLEEKRTKEKGYDFSADFPKLWCAANMRGSQGEREIQYRRKRRSSASKKAANVYLRFITLWQVAGDDSGRSKLAKAFNRWRLNTCDAAVDDLSGSLSTLSRGGTAASEESSTYAPRHIPSLKEMWESAAAAGEGEGTHVHAIIMRKAQADRPLPRELCEAYEREMVERIDRRQAENNVPIVPMPIC
ncbi:hypothetical protein Esi_0036_0106 [Ectocarpus siliculosus]|uniref:EF-hand domain-containing protein n=1 Tax=Ectocarpus siliculosus TaxID=2880 RepID=D8LLD7_ECTSI|nr:hypothetical protein Esi_0036_0106 [Ectocarpus siliculosus]|eukprot:CBN77135.1 hypothetical protein Esi_0036_0106 [Ectocarpus siliculosus]